MNNTVNCVYDINYNCQVGDVTMLTVGYVIPYSANSVKLNL